MLDEGPIDWPACARASIRHGVAPLMADRLESCANRALVPAEAMACFRRMLEANALRNRVMYRECGRLLRSLEIAGIRCLLLKGAGLALTVYAQPQMRNFADIDLLVAESDLEAASAVACSLGFLPGFDETDSCLLHRTFVAHCPEDILTATLPLEYETEVTPEIVGRHRHRIVFEIHRGLFRDVTGIARRVDSAPLLRSPQQVNLLDGTPGLMPSPEVMLVHLCDHAAGHGYAKLGFFADLILVLNRWGTAISWDLVADLAARYEASGRVYRCLEFIQREFEVPLPPEALRKPARATGSRSQRPLHLTDVFEGEREFGPGIVLQGLLQAQSARQFAIALHHILMPPPVLMRRYYGVRHPMALTALYLCRPFLLTGHLAQVLLRRARRQSHPAK